jgi:two-component system, NtrC family, sensor kinase
MTNPITKRELAPAPVPAEASMAAENRASVENRAYPILYVDDEPQNLFTFRYAVEDRFNVITARDGSEAMEVLEREDVAVLMCDQRMPQMSGIEVCRRARELKPDVVRIIVTAYADMQAAIDAINQGQVLRYLTKPWHNDELVDVLQSAIELVRMRRTVHDMQVRVLKGGHPPMIEAAIRQIANELHSPVAALEMNAEQLDDLLEAGLMSWDRAERAKELVQTAQVAQRESLQPIKRLRTMVDRLARGQRLASVPPPTGCDVVRVAQATARILSSVLEPRARLQLVITGAPIVPMDPADLGQVLVHLVMNAAQALDTLPGGHRSVVTLHVADSADGAEIAISDCGPGLTTDQLQRVFDPYYTTREGAAGLGLAVVKHLVAQAGGTVTAESHHGRGARFAITLPSRGR